MNTNDTYLIYAGGTFGSHGVPLSPLDSAIFLPVLVDRLGQYDPNHLIKILPNNIIKDSSTLTPSDFVGLYDIILQAYQAGGRKFVLITGTDTLSFLSAFLANAFAALTDISLIITGSMQPLLEPTSATYAINLDSDAWQNLTDALTASKHHTGVFVQFANKTFHAHDTQKIDSQANDAFVGTPVQENVHTKAIAAKLPVQALLSNANHSLIKTIYCLPNTPQILADELNHLHPDTKAVILIGFGAGNVPSSPALIEALKQLHAKNIPIICTTMCAFGGVNGDYQAGAWQYEYGVWSAAQLGIPAIYGRALWLIINDAMKLENWNI